MTKYEIGTQWKTRGGDKVMILSERQCYHYRHNIAYTICEEGTALDRGTASDLIEPWVEPVEHEGWFNVYESSNNGFVFGMAVAQSREACDVESNTLRERIACIKINFKEGNGI